MSTQESIPSGWVGGFAESNPAFAYPKPDLTSLPMLDNLANINLLERSMDVLWPEFSWETEPGETDPKRCFQMFAPDISRLGYTNEGRVYSIICPQQGACSPSFGCFNVEVTVTGNRGWANETDKDFAADMSVVGKVWFSPSSHENFLVKLLWKMFEGSEHPFPSTKEHAIVVTTHLPGSPDQPIFPLNVGESTNFTPPDFAKHPEAWTVGNLEVQIGPIEQVADPVVNEFNELVMDAFNLAVGNMLQNGNILTWNVWMNPPQLVDQQEWADHAEKWRKSIDADHGSPDGPGTKARYADGTDFEPVEAAAEAELTKIYDFLKKHL